jgi:hypothetical protein
MATAAKGEYENSPSAIGLFRWATYAYEGGRWSVDKYFGDNASNYPNDAEFSRFGSEYRDVYIYARMRFIRSVAVGPRGSLFPVGKRLLKKDPNDRDVKLFMMRLCSARSMEEESVGKTTTEEMLNAQPNDPMTLFSGGKFYWSIWFTKRRDADRARGISLLTKFVSLAPADLSSVRSAKKMIEMMQTNWRPDGGGMVGIADLVSTRHLPMPSFSNSWASFKKAF